MCGICGFLNLEGNFQSEAREILLRMSRSIKHRGPDESGSYLDNQVALGIRRLKVIDMETGHQPIHNEDKRVWVVYNGEIYNFLELRKNLEKEGHRFYTRTDTEVMVHLYEKYGEDFVNRLNGMFAFALWDKNQEKLFLGRDRMGQKPLHYSVFKNQFIFASEIKAILEYPGIKRKIDFASLTKYLAYEFVPAPHSIFKNIKKVLPGHVVTIKNGRIITSSYWDVDFSKKSQLDEREVTERLKKLLTTAIKQRLISDVPLGVLLSGGIDSSTIVALMSQVANRKVRTFTIGFEDQSFDESKYALQVARLFKTKHYEQILSSQKALDLVPQIGSILDEPLGDASIVPTYLLSEFTREKVTVALGGDGGDELFAGYPTHQAHQFANYYEKIPALIREGVIKRVVEGLPASFDNFSLDFKARKFIGGMSYSPPIRHYVWLGSFNLEEMKELLRPEIQREVCQEKVFSDLIQYLQNSELKRLINQTMYLDLKFYLQDCTLVKVDRASMARSLEVRAPFLDRNIVEFAASLPIDIRFDWRFKGFNLKSILKKTMEGVLPENILNREKKGFGIPVAKWISNELKPLVLETFSEERIKQEGIFRPRYIKELLDQHFTRKRDNRKQIWTLLIFELWYQKYIK